MILISSIRRERNLGSADDGADEGRYGGSEKIKCRVDNPGCNRYSGIDFQAHLLVRHLLADRRLARGFGEARLGGLCHEEVECAMRN